MKRTSILCALLGVSVICLQPLRAADPQPPAPPKGECCTPGGKGGKGGPHGKGDMGPLHKLNLTEDQKKQVKAIMDADRPKIEAIREEQMKKIRTILTPEQQKVLDDMQSLHESQKALKKK
ncbi:MAG: hypothetical protein ABI615_12005 [Chthoniobacterales bacterium]